MDSATEAQWNAWCKAHIELALHEYDEHLAKYLVDWVAEEITKTDDFMQRGGESERPVKGRRHRAIRPKARKAPTASLSDAGLQEQLDQRTRERDEALERETATSEILRIISNSPTDLQSALGAIAESAARLLDVAGAEILRVEGDGLRLMAKHAVLFFAFIVHLLRQAKPECHHLHIDSDGTHT